ncbi:hypothetical protein BB8028_0003g12710 [Beauveria bassiana]|uniref:Major facilitator superfamily (MFS) profile domain-containing protein n=1 Tax=Beauveria bassiana TaxID=176275 RepID=A0A2S7Y932_BEABA|nr:hypothetical protein BB8028_0003g12710 [Beauveria bassiana]
MNIRVLTSGFLYPVEWWQRILLLCSLTNDDLHGVFHLHQNENPRYPFPTLINNHHEPNTTFQPSRRPKTGCRRVFANDCGRERNADHGGTQQLARLAGHDGAGARALLLRAGQLHRVDGAAHHLVGPALCGRLRLGRQRVHARPRGGVDRLGQPVGHLGSQACPAVGAGALFCELRRLQMVNIIISDIFSVRRRSLFLGLLEIVWTVAGTVGPIFGGALTQSLSWRWIFWINLPLTGFAFLVLVFFLDVHNPRTSTMVGVKAIDWGGTVCVLGIALMLLIGLNFGGVTFAWNSAQVICLLVFGIVTVPLFIYCEARFARMPLMPLDIFRNAHNSAVFVIDFCHSAVVTGGGWFLPLYFQATQLASPLHSGVLFLPIVISSSLMSGAVGFLIHKTGRYVEIIRLGNVLVASGIGLFINFDSSSSLAKIIAYQLILGFGMGMLFFPPLLALHANVSGGQTAAATATFGFIRSMSASVAVVLGGVLFQNGMNVQQSRLVATGLPSNITDSFKGSDAGANVLLVATIQNPEYQRAVQDAFSDSIRYIWYLYTALGVVGAVSCVFVKTHVMSEVHTEIKTGLDGDRAQEHKR